MYGKKGLERDDFSKVQRQRNSDIENEMIMHFKNWLRNWAFIIDFNFNIKNGLNVTVNKSEVLLNLKSNYLQLKAFGTELYCIIDCNIIQLKFDHLALYW